MRGFVIRVDEDVVQIDDHTMVEKVAKKVAKNVVHEALKGCG